MPPATLGLASAALAAWESTVAAAVAAAYQKGSFGKLPSTFLRTTTK